MRSRASTPSRTDAQRTGLGADARLSLMRPFEEDSSGDVYVAMQLSESTATASYRRVRNFLYVITGLSLLLAITGSFWLAKTVTRPVQDLAQAARRMREGVYNEPINIPHGRRVRRARRQLQRDAGGDRRPRAAYFPSGASRQSVGAPEPRARRRSVARSARALQNDRRREPGARSFQRHRLVARPSRRRRGHQARGGSAARSSRRNRSPWAT